MLLTDYFRSEPDATWDFARQSGVCHGVIRLPEREDFVAVWKFLKRTALDTPLEDTDARIYKLISRALPPHRPHIRCAICLEIMEERGLISLRRSDGRTHITINATTEKVDLEQSELMLRLRSMLHEKKDR